MSKKLNEPATHPETDSRDSCQIPRVESVESSKVDAGFNGSLAIDNEAESSM
jgi:hypothetical protein